MVWSAVNPSLQPLCLHLNRQAQENEFPTIPLIYLHIPQKEFSSSMLRTTEKATLAKEESKVPESIFL